MEHLAHGKKKHIIQTPPRPPAPPPRPPPFNTRHNIQGSLSLTFAQITFLFGCSGANGCKSPNIPLRREMNPTSRQSDLWGSSRVSQGGRGRWDGGTGGRTSVQDELLETSLRWLFWTGRRGIDFQPGEIRFPVRILKVGASDVLLQKAFLLPPPTFICQFVCLQNN